MYDELVKRLRDAAKVSDALAVLLPHSEGNVTAKLYNEAADAIEELRAAVEGYEANTNMVFDRSGNNTVIKFEPKWIPVTERLPLLNTPVLATDGIEVDISWMYGVPPRWITSYTAIDEDKLTHWMPLPQTPKEG